MKNLSLLTALMLTSSMVYAGWITKGFEYKGDCLEMMCDCVEDSETRDGYCCPEGTAFANTGNPHPTYTPCKCPENQSWDSTLSQCVECLTDYQKGEGACPTDQKPLCINNTCQPCPSETPYFSNGECLKCLPIDGCKTYSEDCTCADCTINYNRIFDGAGCKVTCKQNSDCPNGKFCAFERPNSFADSGIGWCQDIQEFKPKTFYNDSKNCWVHSRYPMTWWSAQNWCSAQNMKSATRSTPSEVSYKLGGTQVWLKEVVDSIRGWFMYDGIVSPSAGKSDGFWALCNHNQKCEIEPETNASCLKNSDCLKDEFCAFQNGHFINNTQGPGYCQKINDFIIYPMSVSGKNYVISGTQMSSWSVTNWCLAQGMNRITSVPGSDVLKKLQQEITGGSVWLTGSCLFFVSSGSMNCTAGSPDSFYAMCQK